jgi:hypothetical protein
VETEVEYRSRYADYGVLWSSGSIMTTDTVATYSLCGPTSLWFELYSLTDIAGHGDDDQSEIDIYVGLEQALPHEFTLEAGVGYILFAPFGSTSGDYVAFTATLSRTFELTDTLELTPAIGMDYFIPVKGEDEGGLAARAELALVWHATESLDVEVLAKVETNDGIFGEIPGTGASLEAAVRYAFSDSCSAFIGGGIVRASDRTVGLFKAGVAFSW